SMDKLDRRLIQLKIEREALKKESDEASKKRLKDLEQSITELEKNYADLEEIWKSEKATLQGANQIKEALEQAKIELDTARRAGDLARMCELHNARSPELQKQLSQGGESQTDEEAKLFRNKVTEEEMAEVVSKWTGIPVAKKLEGEKEKLLHMEEA